jgi:hypothetical protein
MAIDQGKTTTAVNLRLGPGTEHASLAVLAAGAPLNILADTGDWLRVDASGLEGFVNERFVARDTHAVPAGLTGAGAADPLPDIALAPPPDQCIQFGGRASGAEKLVAATWNRSGNLLASLAGNFKFETGAAVAVFCTESGGAGFRDGRLLIRFENHHFFRHWGKANPQRFADHFQFNAQKPWTAHLWRPSPSALFEKVHENQSSEWRCFEFARTLDDAAAKLSISMGGPQILGSNHADAGFESVEEMFDAFSSGEKRQIIAFFDFLQGTSTHPPKILALQKLDFIRFAELYNGPGNAAEYGSRLSGTYDAFQKLRPAAAAATV